MVDLQNRAEAGGIFLLIFLSEVHNIRRSEEGGSGVSVTINKEDGHGQELRGCFQDPEFRR